VQPTRVVGGDRLSLAGPLSLPEPSTAAPRSLTTTEAPSPAAIAGVNYWN
jgi:hypothetical protein